MGKTLVSLLFALLSASFIAPAQAAPKASLVLTAFKTLLHTTVDSMDALEQKYEADVDVLDDALSAATKAANNILAQKIQAATDLYYPQIASANQRLEAAKLSLKTIATLKSNNLYSHGKTPTEPIHTQSVLK